ncbi:MAG TPA: MotA/TolQ/ExbB proton channel family protein [Candidatus Xenobia bacterium]|nr:MotA/TolQ/ExbB proton channel family protein [Candidatus Xenobia bacterium]
MALLGFWVLQSELGRLLAQTGWPARIILVILLGFSVYSWAVIWRKHTTLKRAREQSDRFLEAFRSTEHLPEPGPLASAFPASPLAHVYVAGMRELGRELRASNPHGGKLTSTAGISAALQLASANEMARLETRMNFLATCGSVTPFIGLFGTVWGIIGAFMGLSEAGATTLRAVAPGIAEALIATAAGLFAAIPAVVAYNHYLHMIRQFGTRMDNFALEFLARAESQFS